MASPLLERADQTSSAKVAWWDVSEPNIGQFKLPFPSTILTSILYTAFEPAQFIESQKNLENTRKIHQKS
jgi:hypothetical protein